MKANIHLPLQSSLHVHTQVYLKPTRPGPVQPQQRTSVGGSLVQIVSRYLSDSSLCEGERYH